MSESTGVPHKRTEQQSKALHLYFEMVATALNDAGYTVQLFLKQTVDLEWDKGKVKELIWRPIQKALIEKESTTNLDKVNEIDYIYDHINRHLSEKFLLHVPFPSREPNDIAPLI